MNASDEIVQKFQQLDATATFAQALSESASEPFMNVVDGNAHPVSGSRGSGKLRRY